VPEVPPSRRAFFDLWSLFYDAPPVQWAVSVRLPVRDESVDAIVSTEAFHWFTDHDAAIREFRRVLVPRGRVIRLSR
jgi:SAM-dependent methyltransferase